MSPFKSFVPFVPDRLEAVLHSPSRPQQKHVITLTGTGNQTHTSARCLTKCIIQLTVKGFAKLQTAMIVDIGFPVVTPIIPPVSNTAVVVICHLDTFVKKGQWYRRRCKYCLLHIYTWMWYESCCVKWLSVCERVCQWASGVYFMQVFNKTNCPGGNAIQAWE